MSAAGGGGGGWVVSRVRNHPEDAPRVGEVCPIPLPGDLIDWQPTTYRGRLALNLAATNPEDAARYSFTLDSMSAVAVLLRVGDVLLLRRDIAEAAKSYRRAWREANRRNVHPFEVAALYGLALIAAGLGDTWGALGYIDTAAAMDAPNLAPVRALGDLVAGNMTPRPGR